MVINVGALKSGDIRLVEQDIEAVPALPVVGRVSKVIIEAADEEKAGRSYQGCRRGLRQDLYRLWARWATIADVMLMVVVGDDIGVKAAGGFAISDQMKAMVAAGATRIGASAGV
jgi:deoxyribose-phosphate aldolase